MVDWPEILSNALKAIELFRKAQIGKMPTLKRTALKEEARIKIQPFFDVVKKIPYKRWPRKYKESIEYIIETLNYYV